jgi:LacI family transcriptional regulator, gluconate utilization system Gnt-I transcriptional repressor
MIATPYLKNSMNTKPVVKRLRRGTGAVTLRDVAKLAGVAPITASRAINTPALVSPLVLQKVEQAVASTGYVPNRIAGGLASARSRLIAAVVPSMVSSVFMETVESLDGALFESGYQLMLGQSGYSIEREELLLEAIIGRRPDGIFLTGILPSGKGRTRLLASGIPVVETWDLSPTPIDMLIGFSHSDIGREVASYLMGKGRKRFAVVRAEDDRAGRRAASFRDAVARQGLGEVLEINVGAERTLRSGRDAMARIFNLMPDVDALFCSSDLLALGVMTEVRDRGFVVPAQISIVGFGDVPIGSDMVPALTTVRINNAEIGLTAARWLVNSAEGLAIEQRHMDVGFSIVERESA